MVNGLSNEVFINYLLILKDGSARFHEGQQKEYDCCTVRFGLCAIMIFRSLNFSSVCESDANCYKLTRMDCAAFKKLCNLLETHGNLKPNAQLSIEKMVAMFLYTIAGNIKNREVAVKFRRSREVVSQNFHEVLNAVLQLHEILLKKPEPIGSDCTDHRWKWFQNCLGAIDGIHIKVNVDHEDNMSYRSREGTVTTNVFAACAPNGEFIYVVSGYEGCATDSGILREALLESNGGFKVPRGYYYLCDNEYPNGVGFLAPHGSERYHLDEWEGVGNNPKSPKEFFNMKHSQARNIIERAFKVLKSRWKILRTRDYFQVDVKAKIIMACMYLHNHCIREMRVATIDEFNNNNASSTPQGESTSVVENISIIESTDEWTMFRETLGLRMMEACNET